VCVCVRASTTYKDAEQTGQAFRFSCTAALSTIDFSLSGSENCLKCDWKMSNKKF